MKPYCECGGVTIYHGDCLELLPYMPICDLLLTDPPYGVRYVKKRFGAIYGDDSQEMAVSGMSLALERMRRGRHVYVFGRFDLSKLPLTERVELIWDKSIIGSGGYGPWAPQHEYIQFATYQPSAVNRATRGKQLARLRRGSVLRYQRPHSIGIDKHPTEKPVALIRELIECSTKFGEMVLDPFCGSGSTLVAAQCEGRRSIGIEIDERYCEITAQRLSRETLPLAAWLAQEPGEK